MQEVPVKVTEGILGLPAPEALIQGGKCIRCLIPATDSQLWLQLFLH